MCDAFTDALPYLSIDHVLISARTHLTWRNCRAQSAVLVLYNSTYNIEH